MLKGEQIMKHFNLMPTNDFSPSVIEKCGSLFPFITTKSKAIAYAKQVKKQFPNVEFELTEGNTWGSQVLIQTF